MYLRRVVAVFLFIVFLFTLITLRLWYIAVDDGSVLAQAALRQQHILLILRTVLRRHKSEVMNNGRKFKI